MQLGGDRMMRRQDDATAAAVRSEHASGATSSERVRS
eukprot:COSAG03_NODE_13113_length_516_cov_1.067146_2_plen_36_part_01